MQTATATTSAEGNHHQQQQYPQSNIYSSNRHQ